MACDAAIAALTIYCEASSASQAEREAIAHVIRNRVADRRFPKTAAAVCLQRMQFSEWNADAADNRNLMRAALTPDSDPVFRACGMAWAFATSTDIDPTFGATHYHDKTIAPPAWTEGARVTLNTDKFIFYAGVK